MKITQQGPVFSGLDKDGAKLCFLLLRNSLVFLERLGLACPDRDVREIISKSMRVREKALSGLGIDSGNERIDKICAEFQVLLLSPLLEEDIFDVVSDSKAAVCNMFELICRRDGSFFDALAKGGFDAPDIFEAVRAADFAALPLLYALLPEA